MIKFENVSKIYKTKKGKEILVLKNISFEIKKGEFVLLAGRSGVGKTTILKLILREEKPSSGEIYFENQPLSKMGKKEILEMRRKIGVVFQDYKLLKQKTVFENLSFIMETANFLDEAVKRDISIVLELVGLEEKIYSFPDELSAGEKQRLAIARAIIHRPEIILADEPTGNLDLYNTFEVLKIFKKINKIGTTIILATHNKEVVDFLKKRTLFLENGEILKEAKEASYLI